MYIGIDIGGTTIKALLGDGSGRILAFDRIPTGKGADEIDAGIEGLLRGLARAASVPMGRIKAVGVGSAGAIDRRTGTIIKSPNIPAFRHHPLASSIERRTGIKAFLENDATVAVMGEWWTGHGRDYQNWIMLTLGTGIGGGAVIDNRLYTGQTGSALEVGHMSIDYRGRRCPCGSTGCLERYASAPSLLRLARSLLKKYPRSTLHARLKKETLSPRMIEEEAHRGDALSKMVYESVAGWLGIGVANLVNLFNPEAVIFTGGLSKAHRLILPTVKRVVKSRVLEGLDSNLKYFVVRDVERLPALGALKLAMDSYRP